MLKMQMQKNSPVAPPASTTATTANSSVYGSYEDIVSWGKKTTLGLPAPSGTRNEFFGVPDWLFNKNVVQQLTSTNSTKLWEAGIFWVSFEMKLSGCRYDKMAKHVYIEDKDVLEKALKTYNQHIIPITFNVYKCPSVKKAEQNLETIRNRSLKRDLENCFDHSSILFLDMTLRKIIYIDNRLNGGPQFQIFKQAVKHQLVNQIQTLLEFTFAFEVNKLDDSGLEHKFPNGCSVLSGYVFKKLAENPTEEFARTMRLPVYENLYKFVRQHLFVFVPGNKRSAKTGNSKPDTDSKKKKKIETGGGDKKSD